VPDALLIDLREPIASLALKHRIPTLSTIPELTDVGGLLGPNCGWSAQPAGRNRGSHGCA
jgi:hypothetical protein